MNGIEKYQNSSQNNFTINSCKVPDKFRRWNYYQIETLHMKSQQETKHQMVDLT